ncbi:hypothetical protein F9278_01160 [Streptomyces phaeolivaceus]|uniref:Uncharacterized protein n=1 Tax=Streptomyces phaeolivaceus TaxID=2653200 RepID=A0A5P8JX99_9ACTN|nr:DUF5958 family protein [Streptomyces phaeolivaceus]QFQ95029.1 hypothetical protein F9278_01160 [Streptomyces phaeolivaceus]
MSERDVMLNKLAQGLRSMVDGLGWFDGLGGEEQSETLMFLRHHCVQARVVDQDGPEAVRLSGLRPTHTPAVLITCGPIEQHLGKIVSLAPPDERRKALRPLVALLGIADGRRRERFCRGGCGHWWHALSATVM